MSDSQQVGSQEEEDLFNKIEDDPQSKQINAFDSAEEESHKQKKHKRIKKHKKEKKEKKQKSKKKHRHKEEEDEEQDEEDESRGGFRDFFQDEADEDDEQQDEKNSSDEIRIQDINQRYGYKRNTDDFLKKFQGKDGQQINAYYNREVHKRMQNQEMHPNESDPKLFTVGVRIGREEDMAYCILNKGSFFQKDPQKRLRIVSVLALKKKFPGKIFVQAFNEKDIRDSLEGFNDVNLSKITQFDVDAYTNIFTERVQTAINYNVDDYIRIKKGLYEQDLGKIFKTKKNSVDVLLVPRINIQDFLIKMKQQTSKLMDEKQILDKKQQLLKKYINHRISYPKHLRPAKKLLFQDDLKQCRMIPYVDKIRLTRQGLIVLTYRFDQIKQYKGMFLPIQIQPFSKDGQFIEEFQNQKKHFANTINFSKGDQVEITAGQLAKLYGIIVEIKQNTAVIKCKSKTMQGQLLEEPLEHIGKRFKEGQRVKVISGTDKGKTGVILKIQDKHAQIWTDNENAIKVNKNNLQIHTGEVICEQNVHNLKKDDLIKTSKNVVGIVLSTGKDNFKILDFNNTVQIISNLDFDTKINSRNLATKNKSGDLIKDQSIIRILKGIYQGKRCQVKHVYKEYVFVFNQNFDKTSGISVEKADNCAVISKSTDPIRKGNFPQKNNIMPEPVDEELTIGKTIILKTGPLKGYQGVVRTIHKDRIQVRVPSKGCTQWVQRGQVITNQANMEVGKTPRRGPSNTNIYAPSPMNNY